MLYLVGNGAKNVLEAQRITSNNIANASTKGFKADLDYFAAKPVYGPGAPTRVYAADQSASFDTTSGAVKQTGNSLDVAIADDGWMAVQAEDGSVGYTRRGDFTIDANGVLKNGEGLAVLGDSGGPITLPPIEGIEFGTDGTVNVQVAGDSEFAAIDRLMLVKPDNKDLMKSTDGLMRMRDGSEAPADASVSVRGGYIESSNVNVVRAMVELIEHGRAFEFQTKFLEQAENLDKSSARLLSVT